VGVEGHLEHHGPRVGVLEHRDDSHDGGVAQPHQQRRLEQARAQVWLVQELLL
jgi:hypothetical protein